MKKLALLHTVTFLADLLKPKLAQHFPGLEFFNIVDESLLKDMLSAGGLTPAIVRRAAGHAFSAREAGAGVILFTCSSTSPAVDLVRPLVEVPIIKIDDPLAAKAVSLGTRIGVVCTVKTTQEASRSLIESHAAQAGKKVAVSVALEEEAFKAVLAGDKARHDELVGEAAARLSRENEVVVLAQASMAHLAPALSESLKAPVLASLDLCMDALAELLRD